MATQGTHADPVARLRERAHEKSVVGKVHSMMGGGDEPLQEAALLAEAADALAALPPPADPPALVALEREVAELRHALWNIAGTVVAICDDSPREHREIACTDTSPLVGQSREYIARFGLSNQTAPLPAAPPVTASTPTYVEIDGDGDISIDFDRDRHNVCSLTIYQDGRVGYSAIVDGQGAHGIVSAAEPMPSWVRAALCAPLAAPPVPETPQGWTPEYIKSALARAYPQQIQVGDVIEFAHGDDPPMFQRLRHPAAVEDWNGKLRNRVRGIYRPVAAPAVPPQEAP